MNKEMLQISEMIIKQSYAIKDTNVSLKKHNPNILKNNAILLNQLKEKFEVILHSDNKNVRDNACSLYKFFMLMTADGNNNYQKKLDILINQKNREVAEFLITKYLEYIPSKIIDIKKIETNIYNIVPKSKQEFLMHLYLRYLRKDDLEFFALLNEKIAPMGDHNNLLFYFQWAMCENSDKVFNYLLPHVTIQDINVILDHDTNNILAGLKYENKIQLINKVLLNNTDSRSKEGVFFNLSQLKFTEEIGKIMNLMLKAGVDVNCFDQQGFSPLHYAAKNGSVAQIKYLIKNKADVNILHPEFKSTPIYSALIFEKLEAVETLIDNGTKLEIFNKKKLTPLMQAVLLKNLAAITILVKAKANLETFNDNNLTALMQAVLLKDLATVKTLVELGADVNNVGEFGYPPLHIAAELKLLDIVKYLISHGANVNVFDKNGNTALHQAAALGNPEIIAYLLAQGLKVNIKSRDHNTPLHLAVRHNNISNVEYLLKHKANLEVLNCEGHTVFQLAAAKSSSEILCLLKEKGASIHALDANSRNALHLAILCDNNGSIDTLIKFNIDLEALSVEERTPIQLAVLNDNIVAFHKLKQAKANIHVIDKLGQNLLHLAVIRGNQQLIKELVSLGININAPAAFGLFSPIEIAIIFGKQAIFQQLINLKAKFNPKKLSTSVFMQETSAEMRNFLKPFLNQINEQKQKAINNRSTVPDYESFFEIASNPNTGTKLKKLNRKPQATKEVKKETAHKAVKITPKKAENKNHAPQKIVAKANKQVVHHEQHNEQEIKEYLKILLKQEAALKRTNTQNQKPKQNNQKSQETLNSNASPLLSSDLTNTLSNLECTNILTKQTQEYELMKGVIIEHFHSNLVHVILREIKLDHETGRPGIIINKTKNNKYTLLLGSSNAPKNNDTHQFVPLRLSENKQTTYFYEIISGEYHESIKGKWKPTFELSKNNIVEIVNLLSLGYLIKLSSVINLDNSNHNKLNTIEQEVDSLISSESSENLIANNRCQTADKTKKQTDNKNSQMLQ